MHIPEEHKKLLKELGLEDGDFQCFDGESVSYEFDETRGVRLYDPYYRTSYQEYIEVDGWSAWSLEKDTFMSDLLEDTRAEVARAQAEIGKPSQEDIAKAMQKRFGKKRV
ncbi:MAG: hypothetical protein C4576_18810 [Desulfobacteraceae bacterium]|nr:MAG: hypothetical protein C4576_18810 [Desulfobacteraceae bacterium]